MNKKWIMQLKRRLAYRKSMPRPRALGTERFRVARQVITVQAAGRTLYGELLSPQGVSGALPTVICCHGFSCNYKMCEDTIGKSLAMSGYQAYCFDFYGGSTHSKSGGTLMDASIFTQRDDLNAVIDCLKTLPCVDSARLFLLGESQGGAVCAITAAHRREDVRGMVLCYPGFCIPDDARRKFPTVADIPEVVYLFHQAVGKVYYEKLLDYDIFAEIPGYTGPVLLLHGDADLAVPVKNSRRAAALYGDAEYVELPGEPHGFTAAGKLTAAARIYGFLEKLR